MTAEQESWTANQGILGALESQRNRALADEARAHGHIAILEARLSACQKELQASQAEFARVSTELKKLKTPDDAMKQPTGE